MAQHGTGEESLVSLWGISNMEVWSRISSERVPTGFAIQQQGLVSSPYIHVRSLFNKPVMAEWDTWLSSLTEFMEHLRIEIKRKPPGIEMMYFIYCENCQKA